MVHLTALPAVDEAAIANWLAQPKQIGDRLPIILFEQDDGSRFFSASLVYDEEFGPAVDLGNDKLTAPRQPSAAAFMEIIEELISNFNALPPGPDPDADLF